MKNQRLDLSATPPKSGIYLEMVNYERLYESVSDRGILVNNFNMRNNEEKERLNKLLYVEYEGDTLDTKPSCEHGCMTGEHNKGMICGTCGTEVVSVTEKPIESILWIKAPEGVTGFISPSAWLIMNKLFKNLPRYLCDPSENFRPNTYTLAAYNMFQERGWKRSINYFIEHFDEAMQIISDCRVVTPQSVRLKAEEFIEQNKHVFFTKYLPIPHRMVFVAEKTAMGTYVDEVMHSAIDAVRTISSIDSGIMPATQRIKENRTSKVTSQLTSYYSEYTRKNLSKKQGMLRRQVFGSRLDFSARAVITSISDPHDHDSIYIPWGVAVMMLKTHLNSKLLKLGFSPSQAEKFLIQHTVNYHELLSALFDELIAEAPGKVLAALLQRNPSLTRGSTQDLKIPKIKKDTRDNTISMSVLALTAPNHLGKVKHNYL